MNIIELVDVKTIPDGFQDYSDQLKADKTPIVIDNGAYKCRVGWSTSEKPLLDFRNLIAKSRKDRKKEATTEVVANPTIQIGNDIVNIEAVRMLLKTQFDRNVVTHYHNQEQIFDYIFSHLSIDTEGSIPHPIMLTEALANPNYSRQQMNELLFECYGVPAVCYSIDSVLSWQHNQSSKSSSADALVISFGYHTTHVVPVLNGQLQQDRVRRLNIGGYHVITYLFRLMQMKYPVHLNAITISRMEALLHQHSFVAKDYQAALRLWAQDTYYAENVKRIQLPYNAPVPTTSLSAEQRMERRKELSRRLVETNARRAKEKQLEDEELLKELMRVRELHEIGELVAFREALQDNSISNLGALDKQITAVRNRLERMRQKLQTEGQPHADKDKDKDKEKDKEKAIPKPPDNVPLENWLIDIRSKHADILQKRQVRRKRRLDIAKRHTAAAQERMRIISLLARNEKGTDEFGRDDNDWDVYKAINRDRDSDSDTENDKLTECEQILRHYDPTNFQDPSPTASSTCLGPEHYQLHVGVETIRAPELLFQPSMIGSSEAGLAELMEYVLKLFTCEEQLRLAQNVFMTGGCAQLPGLKERLSRELLEMRPFQSPHHIYFAQMPDLDAWLGARDFAQSEDFEKCATTRKDYEENGPEYFREHKASNLFFPTPKLVEQ